MGEDDQLRDVSLSDSSDPPSPAATGNSSSSDPPSPAKDIPTPGRLTRGPGPTSYRPLQPRRRRRQFLAEAALLALPRSPRSPSPSFRIAASSGSSSTPALPPAAASPSSPAPAAADSAGASAPSSAWKVPPLRRDQPRSSFPSAGRLVGARAGARRTRPPYSSIRRSLSGGSAEADTGWRNGEFDRGWRGWRGGRRRAGGLRWVGEDEGGGYEWRTPWLRRG
ncbi:uncharacterized protein A4U43_C10F17690 [Asparagus officinalis]|uniref:Uncharacterized protein n=1 Tax=Asparagus officinalis TaxID=4686 RepID=A0A5P1E8E2_ASPOF|nr:uncharacterized protein A4U43_C10F17690 [Asparagus officinalis]